MAAHTIHRQAYQQAIARRLKAKAIAAEIARTIFELAALASIIAAIAVFAIAAAPTV